MTLIHVLPWVVASLGAFFYTLGTFGVVIRVFRRRKVTVAQDDLGISVLKPMSGLDPRLVENLETFAALKAPESFEVLMCLASEKDAAYPVALDFTRRYPQRFKLVVGANPKLGNAKMAQLSYAYSSSNAANPLIWVSESNVETSQAMMESLVATWKDANAKQRIPTLVHAPLVAVHGEGLGAALERMHLASFQNSNHEVSSVFGLPAVVGKTEFMHRDDLKLVGGIEAFGNYLGEDFMLGQEFSRIGTVRCAQLATRNVLGKLSVQAWFDRHSRWAVMRKTMVFWGFLLAELPIYAVIPFLVAALTPLPLWYAFATLGYRIFIDGLNYWLQAKELPKVTDLLVVPLKELLLFAAWCLAMITFHVKWRADKAIRLGRNSLVVSKTAEPSKLRRHLNSIREVLGAR